MGFNAKVQPAICDCTPEQFDDFVRDILVVAHGKLR
jgi:hypothetical protein